MNHGDTEATGKRQSIFCRGDHARRIRRVGGLRRDLGVQMSAVHVDGNNSCLFRDQLKF